MMLNTILNTLQNADSQLLFSSAVWCTALVIAVAALWSCVKPTAHA